MEGGRSDKPGAVDMSTEDHTTGESLGDARWWNGG